MDIRFLFLVGPTISRIVKMKKLSIIGYSENMGFILHNDQRHDTMQNYPLIRYLIPMTCYLLFSSSFTGSPSL